MGMRPTRMISLMWRASEKEMVARDLCQADCDTGERTPAGVP